jgi:hypothetical protein
MANTNITNGNISNVAKGGTMSNDFKVFGLGLVDQWDLADSLGISENNLVEVDASACKADEIGPRLTLLLAGNPKAILVIGNDHGLKGKALGNTRLVAETFKGRVYSEEELLLINKLKGLKVNFEVISEVEDFLLDLGFNVEPDMEDEDTIVFSAPFGAQHTITMKDGNILLDGAQIKETVMVFVGAKRHPVAQSLLGLKSPMETFSIMMAALAFASEQQAAHYAIGVIKGFSGIFGPKAHEKEQFDAEGIEFKTRDTLGVALLHKSGDKIWATAPSRTAGDLVAAAAELRDRHNDHLIITNNMGDGLFKISFADLETGKNALRIKYDPKTKLVTLNGSNLKGAAKSHAKQCGKVVVGAYITSKDPLSQGGQAVMSRAAMDELLWGKRTIRFGGTKVFEFNQKNLVEFVNMVKDSTTMVDVGDWVFDGDDLYDHSGVTVKADLNGASYARVSRMVFEQESKGRELHFTCLVELEAYDIGEAKARGSIKAMINSMEAAGISATFNGAPVSSMVFGDGVIKASARFREVFKEIFRGELVVTTAYDRATFNKVKKQYEGEEAFSFDIDALVVTTTDPNGVYGELEIMIESTSVQENVTDAAMTLHQYALVAGCSEGNEWLSAAVMPGMRRKVKTLAYLNAISSRAGFRQNNAESIILGQDTLEIDITKGDVELMEEFKEVYPNGVMVFAKTNFVWLKAEYILQVSAEDALGNSLVGFGEVAARLVRLAAQPQVAQLINVDGLITRFKIGAKRLAASKSLNKVFAVRFGVSSKVVSSRATSQSAVEIHPHGRIAKMLKKSFQASKIEGKKVYMLRHPMVVGAVMEIKFNKDVSKHLMQVNEMFWRRVTAGDFDGDTINIFPIKNEKWAEAIDAHLSEVVPNHDMNLALLGVSSESEAMEMFGEKLDTSKTVDDLMNKAKTMPLADFIKTVEGGARAATWHTGTSYRILEQGAVRYALGLGGVRCLFLGAYLYEHRGLAGKPVSKVCEEALNLWVRGPRDLQTMQDMWHSFGAMLHEVPGFINQGDSELPKDLLIGSEMNRLMREGGVRQNSVLLGKGWCEYNDLYPIQALAWKLGRRQLAGAPELAAQVLSMGDIAEAYGFNKSFLFKTLKLVSKYIGDIHSKLGGAIEEQVMEEVVF